jgi:hypothetical protein
MTRSGMGHLAHQVTVPLPEWDVDAPGDVALDAGIVELIQALWTLGVETVQSCEGGPGSDGVVNTAWVSFSDNDDAWDFARRLVEANDGHTELTFSRSVLPPCAQ